MSKDKSTKDSSKKEKKEKRSEKDGVKKSKKDKKSKLNGDNVAAALEEVTKRAEPETDALVVVKEGSGEVMLKAVGALVPFANPLADEKVAKKVLKGVKKGSFLLFAQLTLTFPSRFEFNTRKIANQFCSGEEQDS